MVTLNAARPTGSTLSIRGVRVPERSTDVTRGGVLQSVRLELELDKVIAVEQELRRDIIREALMRAAGDAALQININAEAKFGAEGG